MNLWRIKIIISILIFTFGTAKSQVKLEKEEINGKTYLLNCIIDEDKIQIIEREGIERVSYAGYDDPGSEGEISFPKFDLFIAIPIDSRPNVELSPIAIKKFKAIPLLNSKAVLADSAVHYLEYTGIPKHSTPNSPVTVIGYLMIDGNYCVHLKLNLIDANNFSLSTNVITKFNLVLKFDNESVSFSQKSNLNVNPIIFNKSLATTNTVADQNKMMINDEWIDYTKNYVKLGTNKTGIHRLNYTDLSNYISDQTAIDPGSFKLICRGKELPIYVSGESDGRFDQTDFIEFPGFRNLENNYRETSKAGEPYKEYVNRYSDTTVYWLTWGGERGKRASSFINSTFPVTDTLTYYQEIVHQESNNWFDYYTRDLVYRENPNWYENKTWNEGNLGVGTRSVTFSVSDIFPNKRAYVYSKLQDYASDVNSKTHLLAIGLNNEIPQDSLFLNKYEQAVLKGEYNSNSLTGGNNALKVFSYPTKASVNTCIMDWYELEYPRYIKPFSDSLNFRFSYLNKPDIYTIRLSGLKSSKKYIVWRSGSSFARSSFIPNASVQKLNDTVSSYNSYLLTDTLRTLKPKIYYSKKFENILNKNANSKYLLLTNKSFLAKANEYSSFVSQQYRITSSVTDVGDVYDLYSYGFFNPEGIRSYFRDLYSKPDHALNYIFIVGAATYDYLGNVTKYQKAPRTYNYVPSYGAPVSDSWFVMLDSSNSFIPQISIGRLPVNSIDEFNIYFQRHKDYVNQKNSFWNKRYLFFSGGTGTDETQIDNLKKVNSYLIDNLVLPAPVGGSVSHFYKTINPSSNFGPYSQQQIKSAIDSGGVFISYIGHSGTQTWDNSITDPQQLKNLVNLPPLVTDFGCSTAKFAEPDITSFSQLFVSDKKSLAIGYIGNSSVGFTSTSLTFPKLFYKKILIDSVTSIGDAHRLAKIDFIKIYGTSGVYSLFALTNTLIGDPVIKLRVPSKADLIVDAAEVRLATNIYSDIDDSAFIKINYFNIGSVTNSSFKVELRCLKNGTEVVRKNIVCSIPLFQDSLIFSVPVKNNPGNYTFHVNLDSDNTIIEQNENNNQADFFFNISSKVLRNLIPYSTEGQITRELNFINPLLNPKVNTFDLEISDNINFGNSEKKEINFDSAFTKIQIDQKYLNNRVWIKTNLTQNSNQNTFSAKVGSRNSYLLDDSLSFSKGTFTNTVVKENHIELIKTKNTLETTSAGFNDGSMALISVNRQNYIPANNLRGHHVVVLKDTSFEFVEYFLFDVLSGDSEIKNYISFLDTVSSKFIVAIAVTDEGSIGSTELKNKIKLMGSKYIDSLSWRGSWTIIGKKGAKTGTVPEAFSKAFGGRVSASYSSNGIAKNGNYITSKIGPASKWNSIKLRANNADSLITTDLICYNSAGSIDTIKNISSKNSILNLGSVNAVKYNSLSLRLNLKSVSPVKFSSVQGIDAGYIGPPELLTNYQTVVLSRESYEQGENAQLKFSVYNAGESTASKFKIKVELVKKDNSKEKLFEQVVDSIKSESKKQFELTYNTSHVNGNLQFNITIDPENSITELYKDNNFYSIPFYVKPNDKPASLKLTIDGSDILNGDFVSSKPAIKIELNDESQITINDTNKILVYLNNKRVYFSNSSKDIAYSFSSSNPKMIVNYNPELKDGDYTLKIIGKNATDQIIDSAGVIRKFSVKNELQLLSAFNYPNPFREDTYFTFKLTQVPDELRIAIFTIVGRKIKEIKVSSQELHYDFNRIYWDGRDAEGDLVANGTYLYKIISVKGNEKTEVVQKLSIAR